MADVNITPKTVLLTAGQATTFRATDAAGAALSVAWAISPATAGSVAHAPPATSPSCTYVAPQEVTSAQTVAITAASSANISANATIYLTPALVEVTPAAVDLREGERQQFRACVAGEPAEQVEWTISPAIGTIENGVYTAPESLSDSATVTVIASTASSMKTAKAAVTLAPAPWTGRTRTLLGAYLLIVFSLGIILLVGFWPKFLPDPATAKADRLEAEKTVLDTAAALDAAKKAIGGATQVSANRNIMSGPQGALAPAAGGSGPSGKGVNATAAIVADAGGDPATLATGQSELVATETDLLKSAKSDLEKKQEVEKQATLATTTTKFRDPISRELDLLLLVLLGGALGSFLHTARSYSDFIGNRKITRSWAWWYVLHPFLGAGLALVFYLAVRGGFLAITPGSNIKASDLSPFAVASLAAFVGMFSKQATTKLADVFDTLFRPNAPQHLKDALNSTSTPSGTTSAADAGARTRLAEK